MHFIRKIVSRSIKVLLRLFGWCINDKNFYRLQYYAILGKLPNIDNPSLYTEKLQWLKLYDHNPLYTQIVDKYEVKQYISKIIGDQYIIPTIGVWDSPKDIDFNSLPNRFVLKTTFGGGGDGIAICRDKEHADINVIREKIEKSFNTNPYLRAREWPYKNVPHRVIAEKYMEDDSGELRDYKFYCFDGIPKVMLVASNRFTNHNFNYFDMDFKVLPITSAMGSHAEVTFERPACFDEMKDIAAKLSAGFSHVRVDLYYCEGKTYFGELTLYDSSGFDDLNSEEWNQKFGDWLKLPEKKNGNQSTGKGFGNEAIDMFY